MRRQSDDPCLVKFVDECNLFSAAHRRVVLREHVAKAVQHGRDEVYTLFWQNVCKELGRVEDAVAAEAYSQAARYLSVCDCPAWDRRAEEAFATATALLRTAECSSLKAAQYREWGSVGGEDGAD